MGNPSEEFESEDEEIESRETKVEVESRIAELRTVLSRIPDSPSFPNRSTKMAAKVSLRLHISRSPRSNKILKMERFIIQEPLLGSLFYPFLMHPREK